MQPQWLPLIISIWDIVMQWALVRGCDEQLSVRVRASEVRSFIFSFCKQTRDTFDPCREIGLVTDRQWRKALAALWEASYPQKTTHDDRRVCRWQMCHSKQITLLILQWWLHFYHLSKNNKQRKICLLLQCLTNSCKSWEKTRKKHQNDFLECSLPRAACL